MSVVEYFPDADGVMRELPRRAELYVRLSDYKELESKYTFHEATVDKDYANLKREAYHYSSMIEAVKSEMTTLAIQVRHTKGEIVSDETMSDIMLRVLLIQDMLTKDYKLPGDAMMYKNERLGLAGA